VAAQHAQQHAPAGSGCQAGDRARAARYFMEGRAVKRRDRPSRMRGTSRER
jgi:hypothetical protein